MLETVETGEIKHPGVLDFKPRRAPGIVGILPRSKYGPCEEARAIREALGMAKGCTRALPVVYGRRVIGMATGKDWWSDIAGFKPMGQWCGFTDFSDMISELSSGKKYGFTWAKSATTAGVANNWYDLWPVTGNPAPGDYSGTALTSRQFDDTTTGSIWHGGNKSTDTKHFLTGWVMQSTGTFNFMLTDRVLAYDSNTFTAASSQNFTTTLTAQRYASNGDLGLIVSFVVDTVHNATGVDFTTLTYVDNAGNTGQTMPTTPTVSSIDSGAASTANLGARVFAPATSGATVTWGYAMPLANGDTGVQKLTNITTSAARTGTFAAILHQPLIYMPVAAANIISEKEFVMMQPSLARILDGACLNIWHYASATSAPNIIGGCDVGWG